jgi:hypothetical protein
LKLLAKTFFSTLPFLLFFLSVLFFVKCTTKKLKFTTIPAEGFPFSFPPAVLLCCGWAIP